MKKSVRRAAVAVTSLAVAAAPLALTGPATAAPAPGSWSVVDPAGDAEVLNSDLTDAGSVAAADLTQVDVVSGPEKVEVVLSIADVADNNGHAAQYSVELGTDEDSWFALFDTGRTLMPSYADLDCKDTTLVADPVFDQVRVAFPRDCFAAADVLTSVWVETTGYRLDDASTAATDDLEAEISVALSPWEQATGPQKKKSPKAGKPGDKPKKPKATKPKKSKKPKAAKPSKKGKKGKGRTKK